MGIWAVWAAWVASAVAGEQLLCSSTSSQAQANGSWEVLEKRDRDAVSDVRVGSEGSRAVVETSFGASVERSLCPVDDPMGGIALPERRSDRLVQVKGLPGEVGPGCWADVGATAGARAEAWAEAENTALSAAFGSQSALSREVWNSGSMEADAGGGSQMTSLWAWRSGGVSTVLEGSVTVEDLAGYSGASLSIPGVLQLQAAEGQVEYWVREADGWRHAVEATPTVILVSAPLPGKKGTTCATGSATVGGRVGARMPAQAAAAASISFSLSALPSSAPYTEALGPAPTFSPCRCD